MKRIAMIVGIIASILIIVNGIYLAHAFVSHYLNPQREVIPTLWLSTTMLFLGVISLYGFFLSYSNSLGFHLTFLSTILLAVLLSIMFSIHFITRTMKYFIELFILCIIGFFLSCISISLQIEKKKGTN